MSVSSSTSQIWKAHRGINASSNATRLPWVTWKQASDIQAPCRKGKLHVCIWIKPSGPFISGPLITDVVKFWDITSWQSQRGYNTRLHNRVGCRMIKAPWSLIFGRSKPSDSETKSPKFNLIISSMTHYQHFLQISSKSICSTGYWSWLRCDVELKLLFCVSISGPTIASLFHQKMAAQSILHFHIHLKRLIHYQSSVSQFVMLCECKWALPLSVWPWRRYRELLLQYDPECYTAP